MSGNLSDLGLEPPFVPKFFHILPPVAFPQEAGISGLPKTRELKSTVMFPKSSPEQIFSQVLMALHLWRGSETPRHLSLTSGLEYANRVGGK